MPRLLAAALALLLVACAGARSASAPATPLDTRVDVAGVPLHVVCAGDGAPAVVLDAGLGNDVSLWDDTMPAIATFTRVCAFDRPGAGKSGPPPGPRTARDMANDLGPLLKRADVGGPYVLVGHSLGGVEVRLFASEHAADVAGVVLVDAMTADQAARAWSRIPPAAMSGFKEHLAQAPERIDFQSLSAGLADMGRASSPAAASLGARPLVVLVRGRAEPIPGGSASDSIEMLAAWQAMQDETARLSTNAIVVRASDGGHLLPWETPHFVVAGVREAVAAVREGRPLDRARVAAFAGERPPPRP